MLEYIVLKNKRNKFPRLNLMKKKIKKEIKKDNEKIMRNFAMNVYINCKNIFVHGNEDEINDYFLSNIYDHSKDNYLNKTLKIRRIWNKIDDCTKLYIVKSLKMLMKLCHEYVECVCH